MCYDLTDCVFLELTLLYSGNETILTPELTPKSHTPYHILQYLLENGN